MSDYSNAVRINYNEDFNNVEVSGNVTPDSKIDIEKYVGYFINLWKECGSDSIKYGPVYTRSQKMSREKDIDKFFDAVKKEANKNGFDEKQNLRNYEKFSPAIKTFLKEGLNFTEGEIDLFFSHDFLKITSQFIESARIFDPALSPEDIFHSSLRSPIESWLHQH